MVYNDLNDPTGYWRAKQWRTEHYFKYVYRWKLIPCVACNGSGYYDNDGSPNCGGCDGTGKDRVSPAAYARYREAEREWNEKKSH